MVHSLLPLLLLASPGQLKLASQGFSSLNLPDKTVTYYSDHFAQQLTLAGFRVIQPQEIATLLGIERQRQLLGCDDGGSSCLTELGDALGVDGVIRGTLGKFDDEYQINIKILASAEGRTLSAYSARVKGEKEVLDELVRAGKRMAEEVRDQLRPPAASGPARRLSWIPMVGGALLVAGGIYPLVVAKSQYDDLAGHRLTLVEPNRYAADGATSQALGLALVGTGIAALVTGGAMYVFGATAVEPSVALGPQGAGVTVRGVFP